jgi:hypothetical protein
MRLERSSSDNRKLSYFNLPKMAMHVISWPDRGRPSVGGTRRQRPLKSADGGGRTRCFPGLSDSR